MVFSLALTIWFIIAVNRYQKALGKIVMAQMALESRQRELVSTVEYLGEFIATIASFNDNTDKMLLQTARVFMVDFKGKLIKKEMYEQAKQFDEFIEMMDKHMAYNINDHLNSEAKGKEDAE
jgi:hypothetical protein